MTPTKIKRLCSFAFIAFLMLVVTGPQSASAQGPVPVTTGPFIPPPVKGVSFTGDLRKLPKTKNQPVTLPSQLRSAPSVAPSQPSAPFRDPVRQALLAPLSMPGPIRSFDGLDDQTWGARLQPDSNGDVGPNHFVQGVNMALGVYGKSGNLITAVTLNDWWYQPAQSTACYTKNHIGDPIVVYNYLADRWAVIDIAIENWNPGPMWLCLAVSKSGDPVTGGWWFYAFNPDPLNTAMFPDEPRLGMWPDGLYAAALMRDSTQSYAWRSYRAWAIDWTSAFSGQTLKMVYFDTNVQPDVVHAIWMLPGNTRRTLPPAGTPNFFGAVWAPNTFWLWKFHVDWANLNNSTFLGPTTLTTAPFSSSFSTTVPEPSGGALNPFVDNRLLLQLQYRNIAGVQSLWANHTVLTGGVTGLRWYQITDPNGTPAIAQQGTWQPDNNYRFQGSMAVDGNGDMALSYTMSSATIPPSILYAGRLPSDAAGTLGQGEGTLIAGPGIQTGSDPGWGNYFSTTVDPIDDCTIWFTNKYYTTTTVTNTWLTRIGAFKFPACNPTPYPTNHTVTFDGVVNPNIEWNPNGDKLGSMNGIDYYATWDANHLSVALAGGAVTTNTYVAVVDTDSSNRTSTNTGATGSLLCAGFNGNGKGNFAVARSAAGTGKYQASSGAWGAWTPSAGTDAKDNGSNNVEFQFQWSDLGLLPPNSSVGLYLYVCNGTTLVSAWPPENVQGGTTPVLNTEVVYTKNDTGRIPRTYGRHVGDEQVVVSGGGPFRLLNGYVGLGTVSGVSSCAFTASVNGNADTSDPSTIRRSYVLSPGAGCSGLTADVTLKYEDGTLANNAPDELAGFAEASLKLLRWSGTAWSSLPTTVDTVNNAATTTAVSQFSPWSLGKGTPTAVTISSFTAIPQSKGEAGSQAVLGLGLFELLVVGLAIAGKSIVRH